MQREFTRRELYDLVWSQPMRTVATSFGISDVATAKYCKKAAIPVPPRGYWARKQASKPTIQIALPPRFPGASDLVEIGGKAQYGYWGSNWPEHFVKMPIPPIPTFDEEIALVVERIRKMVGKVRCLRNFDTAHPLVSKLLGHDEERRKDYLKWGSSYYAPKYDAGVERRRLLILNTIFMAAARLGCRPSMNTSKYAQDSRDVRDAGMTVGDTHVSFTIEPIKSKKEGQKENLRLSLGTTRPAQTATKFWEDNDESSLEVKLTEILVEMLLSAEVSYRESLNRHREWVIERRAEAEKELQRRKEEEERKARELREKQAKERIDSLLAQAKALDQANQIRAYVRATLARSTEIQVGPAELDRWATWAQDEANRIDPVINGTVVKAIDGVAQSD